MAIHTGSWGTPELGITEAIGSLFGNSNRTAQGGSNLTSQVGSYPTAIIGGQALQGPGLGWSGDTYNNGALTQDTSRSFPSGGGSTYNPVPQGYTRNSQGTIVQGDVNRPAQSQAESDASIRERQMLDQQALEGQMDAVYNPQFDYLNQTEQFYKNQLPGYQQEANQNYDVNKQLLGTSLTNAQTGINTQETTGKRATEDAMAKARRVFMEQQIGNQQRFGGSSSAGGAMSELLARNLQSEQGQIGRQATDYTQQIGQLRQQAQQKFDDSVLQLEQQKQKALNDIQREFDQKMMEIGSNRTQLTSAKAQMKLQALMDLRNQTFAVQQQEAQFKQALQMQLAQSQGSAGAGAGSLTSLQNQAGTAGQNYAGTLGANQYGLTSDNKQYQSYAQPQYVGSIKKSVTGKDELGRSVYSDGTAGWSQY